MQPQAYNRATDFTDRTGDDTDNSAINLELDAAALSINEIRDNLKLIQRDDGALVNGIVTADALDDSAFDAVQASVNAATVAAQNSANSALTSAITANNAKDAAVIAKTSAETARDSSGLNATNAAASAIAANNSSSAAAASEAAALISKNAAQASQTAAAASAASASGSASTSTAQAGIATTKAGESAASQLAAATSEAAALASKNAAATSEANALSSKNAAATSQTSAAASAATSTTKAGEASASAVAAAASQADALASKNAAATSESNALASKNAAATSETNAATQAGISTAQANISTTKAAEAAASASNSAASAVSAASSAASAAALLDNFDDRYLGSKSSAPTVDNDGNALLIGALYFDSTTGKMRVYTASGWLDASSASVATLAVFNFTATAGQTSFSGADIASQTLTYTVGSLFVTLNGIDLKQGTDYTATTGSSIVLASGAAVGDELRVYAFGSFLVADTYTRAQADAGFVAKDGSGNVNVTGNLGVGTSSPNAKTQIVASDKGLAVGTANFTPSAGTMAQINSSGNSSSETILALASLNDGVRAKFLADGQFQFNSGYGSAATAYGCRAWVNFNGTGTVAIRASGNVSSITDNGAGDYTVNFANSMPDANYSCVMMAGHKNIVWGLPIFAGLSGFGTSDSHATNRVRVVTNTPSDVPNDTAMVNVAIFR